ncbi:hypothetical protein FIBSPDRAFT_58368 [Athelia psychrophila]|uniref:Uncharacterized protein n=1 Tax=Athelia psychrophila TaxID=1759441 RepID=A0A166F7C2_9AGAM|nr:hypothetical protein FIBSPDRAFT_58368 [Fibularhizoctonia sp. CBS 109695]
MRALAQRLTNQPITCSETLENGRNIILGGNLFGGYVNSHVPTQSMNSGPPRSHPSPRPFSLIPFPRTYTREPSSYPLGTCSSSPPSSIIPSKKSSPCRTSPTPCAATP